LVWEPKDDDGIIESPGVDLEHTFEEEIEGVSEYSVSLWTRWLTTYPDILMKKAAWHSIFRLSSTPK